MLVLDWNIVFNMINVFVLFLLMKKFLFGPVNEIMEKRKQAIEDSFTEADKKNSEALQLKQEFETALASADDKASDIIREARQRAVEIHEKQITETKAETLRMIEEANKSIELERKKSMQDIQSEIAGIAMIAAAKVIQKNVDEKTNTQLINDFLSEAGAGK